MLGPMQRAPLLLAFAWIVALVAVAHKLLGRVMGRLRAYYAGQSLQGVA